MLLPAGGLGHVTIADQAISTQATITLAVSIVAMVLPFIHRYKGYLLPFNLIMSYLWLTSFIFSTQDWAGGRCPLNGPGSGDCGLKKTVIAFNFLAL